MLRKRGRSRASRQRFAFRVKFILAGVLIPAVVAFVLITSAVPTYPQTPTPSDIRSEIRSQADSDVANEIPRRNDAIIKLYSGKAGLADAEIWKLYDDEYTKRQAAKDLDPHEWIKPKNGWFAVLPLVMIAFFREKIGKWINAVLEAISNAIFNRFAGSVLFRQRALRQYQQALIKEYRRRKIIFQQ
jgi:hypothetical protein